MSKHFLELISLWVAPFAHGHGAGDSAVRRALAWAPIEHGRRPVVLSVKTNTDPAIQLYRRHEFTDVDPSPDAPNERVMRL